MARIQWWVAPLSLCLATGWPAVEGGHVAKPLLKRASRLLRELDARAGQLGPELVHLVQEPGAPRPRRAGPGVELLAEGLEVGGLEAGQLANLPGAPAGWQRVPWEESGLQRQTPRG